MRYRIACMILGAMLLLGVSLPQAPSLPAWPPRQDSAIPSDEMPVEGQIQVLAPLEVDANRRPIRYWVLAGQEFQLQFRGQAAGREPVPLTLELALPAGLERTGGALRLETEKSGRLLVSLVARRPGGFIVKGTVTDISTGFSATTQVLVSVVRSAAEARRQLLEARQPPAPAPVQIIVDAGRTASPPGEMQPPPNYAHIHGIAYTYEYTTGLSYMLRGIQVQLWEDAATDILLNTLYTVEPTIDQNYGLTHVNWVEDGAWIHDDDSGSFDFGNVWVGSGGKDLYLKVRYIFHDGGDGQTGGGIERLAVRDSSVAGDPVVESPYATQHYGSGQDSGIIGLQAPALDGSNPGQVGDEAAHVFYDLVKAFTYFRNLVGYTHLHTTAYIDYTETDGPYCPGYSIRFNGWNNGYLAYEKTDILLHEYAHSIHYGLRGGSFPPFDPCDTGTCDAGTCVNGDCNHGGCANVTSADGLIEGWAEYLPTRINQDPIFHWYTNTITATWDIRPNTGSNALCDRDEWTVAAILYDVVQDVGGGEHPWFDHVASTLSAYDDNYVQDYYDSLVGDWGQWCAIWTTFDNHNVAYPAPALAAPVLNAPGNGGQTCDTTPAFDWTDVVDAASYRIQVDDNLSFVSPAIDATPTTSGYTPASPLAPGFYYWRARAANACTDGDWSAVHSFTILAAPAAPVPYWPADGSQLCSAPPYVTWNGVAGATTYRVQLDDDPAFGSPFIDATTASTSYPVGPSLPLGTFYWRVRAANACGSGSWSSMWSFTFLVTPSTPVLESPADDSATCDATPLLDWADVSWASAYRIQIDNDAYFGSPEVDTVKSNSLYNPGVDLPSGTWHWRVQASNLCGDSAWASPWQFTVQAITEVPALWTPAGGEETCDRRPVFTWSPVLWATTYRLQVDEPPSFSSPIIDIWTPDTTYIPLSDLPPSAYHWRVMAANDCGPTEFSPIQEFSITWSPNGAPSLWNPSLGAEVCEASLHFGWSTVDRATVYHIQVDGSSDFSSPEIDDVTPDNGYWPAGVMPLGQYYWHVRAGNACGDGPWSSSKWFTTIAGPPAPEPLSPDDGYSACGSTPDFDWSPVDGAQYYGIQVDDDPAFGSLEINDSTPDSYYSPASPLPPGTYFWRVYTYVHPCHSFYTPVRRLTIGDEPPPPPALQEPAGGSTVCTPTPLIDWSEVSTAASYRLLVDDQSSFASPVIDLTTVDSSYTPAAPLALGEYWVEVRGSNACGDGDWSSAQSFAVAAIPPPPSLSTPADGSEISDLTPRFAWSPGSGAVSYRFQVAEDPAFGSLLIDTTTPGAEYTPGRALSPGAYHWRVQAMSICGSSDWSPVWTFTCLNVMRLYLPLVLRSG